MTARPNRTAVTSAHRQLVYDTTRWERLLFDARAKAGTVGDAVRATAAGLRSAADTDAKGRASAVDLGTEVFARLYADPSKLDPATPNVPAWAPKAHEVIDQLPEFEALRASVAGDPDMAAIATAECLQAIASKLPELLRASGTDRNPNPNPTDAAAVRAALRKGIARAEQRVGDAREALAGLAPGMEAAPPTHEQADAGRLTLAERLLHDPRLRDTLRRAGRISRLARDRRTTRDLHSRQEVVDIERGADLARILPASLARLRHPMLRKVALREIVERQAPQYRLEARETLGRGPIVVLLDRSGSMSGDPELWASATAIALYGAAAREHRPCTVAEFTTSVDQVARIDAKGQGSRLASHNPSLVTEAWIALPTLAMELATRRSCGGTEFGPALRYGMACGALDDRADLVIVTDGLADADAATLAKLQEAKGRGLRVYALTVNGGSLSPSIKAIADVAVDLDRVEDIGEAIASAFPQ